MKKELLAIAFTIFGLLSVNAQDRGDFELGLAAGISFANISSSEEQIDTSSRTAFNIAASGEYYFSESWGLKAKLIYDSKGWGDQQITNEITNETITTDFKLNYITIPLLVNFHYGYNRSWYSGFGPYVGLLASAEDSELGVDLKEGFSSNDFGIALNIGYKLQVDEKIWLFAEVDAQVGLSDIFQEDLGDQNITNVRGSLNVGALFSL